MASPIPSPEQSPTRPFFANISPRSSEADRTVVNDPDHHNNRFAATNTTETSEGYNLNRLEQTRTRKEDHKLKDDLTMLQAERVTIHPNMNPTRSATTYRSRSRVEPVDAFDADTNPIHEKMATYKSVEHPSTGFAKFSERVRTSFWLLRYIIYVVPVTVLLLIPLLIGILLPSAQSACVGGVELVWFSVWLQVVWLTLWAGRVAAKMIPWPLGLIASLFFTNNPKKWRDLGKALEVPATIFFWLLAIEISFLSTMNNHHCDGRTNTLPWEDTMNSIIISLFVGAILNLIVKLILQLIAINFHLRTFDDRIEVNKFQIRCLEKLYTYSKKVIALEDSDFEDRPSGPASGARTPAMYVEKAQKAAQHAFAKVGDVTGAVAGDFTGKTVSNSSHPHQVVITLLRSVESSQVLARRLHRTFVRPDAESIFSDDLKSAFEDEEEADAAFAMFDKDMNGDISRKELESVCAEIGQERKAITASLKDLGSVVTKLGSVLFFMIIVVTILVFLTLVSKSAAGVLTSAGSAVLALSWLFSATAQEFLQSVVFVFVKHPFDVNDRVTIYGNTGPLLHGDDYFVKKISLLYTEFKKMEGHIVQAPNSYLNTLFILNMRRSGGLAEAVPIAIKFGTTIDQINGLRDKLLEFVTSEKREFQPNIVTELRDVTEAYSITLNVVFFYKSNWQNELLRLTRRNNFICAMMLAMQDLGIEGPRRLIPGAKEESPWFVQTLTPRENQYTSRERPAADGGPDKPKQIIVTGSAPVDEDVRAGAVNMETIREVNERDSEAANTSVALTSDPSRSSTDSQGDGLDRRAHAALRRNTARSTESRSPRRFMSRLGRRARRSEDLEMRDVNV